MKARAITYDAVIVGGGPAGATAATDLAKAGRTVLLLDRAGRIKPCGGAIPPRLLSDFSIPHHLMVAKARSARSSSSTVRPALARSVAAVAPAGPPPTTTAS
jgi:flavin-dependent dehydrogenase